MWLAVTCCRPAKASFTSLSTRIGEIVGELHLRLAALLSSAAMVASGELTMALLGVAQVLGLNGPYGRLKRPLARPLCDAIQPLLRAQGACAGRREGVRNGRADVHGFW